MLDWVQLGTVTEEHFYSTVIRFDVDPNTKVVRQNTTADEIRVNSASITFTSGNTLNGICPRFTSWYCSTCFGQCQNSICNFHVLDLNKVKEHSTECLIANKFNLDVDSSAVSQHWLNILLKMSNENESENNWNVIFWKDIIKMFLQLTNT